MILIRSNEIDELLEKKLINNNILDAKYRLGLEYKLRELIFVRLISALEVFLTDTIKDIFTYTKVPFMDNSSRFSLSQGELLSLESISEIKTKIILKETRKLSSSGFNEIMKYYKKKFNLDLSSFPPGKAKMIKYHEIRHLLVHRLGKTDQAFRKKFNSEEHNISISEKFILEAINEISIFVDKIKLGVQKFLDNQQKNQNQVLNIKKQLQLQLKFKCQTPVPFFIKPNFEFWCNEEIKSFSDINSVVNYDGKKIKILLSGNKKLISNYYKTIDPIIKRSKEYGYPQIKRINPDKKHKKSPKERVNLDHLIPLVQEILPEQPWKKGIHKEIAKNLNISNKQANRVINRLIKMNIFKDQIDGKVID